MRRRPELADHHDLAAIDVERQHRDDLAGAQDVARLRAARQRHLVALVIEKAFAQQLGRRQRHSGGTVGKLFGVGHGGYCETTPSGAVSILKAAANSARV